VSIDFNASEANPQVQPYECFCTTKIATNPRFTSFFNNNLNLVAVIPVTAIDDDDIDAETKAFMFSPLS